MMPTKEEIKVGIERVLDTLLFSPSDEDNPQHVYKELECVDNLLSYLHSQGVVMAIIPDDTPQIYRAVEPLIEDN